MFAEGFGNTHVQQSSEKTPRGYKFISAEELKKREGTPHHDTVADHFAEPLTQAPETTDLPPSSRTLGGYFSETEQVAETNITGERDLEGDNDEGAYHQVVMTGGK